MKLKGIHKQDKDYLWHTYQSAMQTHIDHIWGWDLAWQQADFDKNLAKYYNSLIIKTDRTMGYIQYSIKAKTAYINMLILEPAHQSQGLGGEVLQHLIIKYKLEALSLRCFKVNVRAFDFYIREGFKVIAEDDNFYVLAWNLRQAHA